MIDIKAINEAVKNGDAHILAGLIQQKQIYIKDGKIFATNKEDVKATFDYWDKRQLVRKILLNSALT